MHALPRAHLEANKPFSRAVRAPSLLSNSLSHAVRAPQWPSLTWPPHPKEKEPYTNQQPETSIMTRSKPRQAPTQSKTSPDRLKEVSVLARQDNGWRPSWRGLPPQGRLPWSPPVAIARNEAGRASRSTTKKGDFCPKSLEIEIARRAVRHLAIYTAENAEAAI
jgi:hypothetical protein